MVAWLRDRLQASGPITGIEVIAIGRKIRLLSLLRRLYGKAVGASLRAERWLSCRTAAWFGQNSTGTRLTASGGWTCGSSGCWSRDAKVNWSLRSLRAQRELPCLPPAAEGVQGARRLLGRRACPPSGGGRLWGRLPVSSGSLRSHPAASQGATRLWPVHRLGGEPPCTKEQPSNNGLKLTSGGMARRMPPLAADMERPLSSLATAGRCRFVSVQGRWRSLGWSSWGVGDDGGGRALRRRVTLICAGCTPERAEPHDRSPSRGNAVLTRESGRREPPCRKAATRVLWIVPAFIRRLRPPS